MERQRVVHYARTKTAKVLGPPLTKRPLSAPISLLPDPENQQAPLASIEPDVLVSAKGEGSTKMAPVNYEQNSQNTAESNAFNIYLGSGQFNYENSFQTFQDVKPPQTFVIPRSIEKFDKESFIRENQSRDELHHKKLFSYDAHSVTSINHIDRPDFMPGNENLSVKYNTLQPQDLIGHRELVNPCMKRKLFTRKEYNTSDDMAKLAGKNTGCFTLPKVVPRTPVPLTSKSALDKPESIVSKSVSPVQKYINNFSVPSPSSAKAQSAQDLTSEKGHSDSFNNVHVKQMEISPHICSQPKYPLVVSRQSYSKIHANSKSPRNYKFQVNSKPDNFKHHQQDWCSAQDKSKTHEGCNSNGNLKSSEISQGSFKKGNFQTQNRCKPPDSFKSQGNLKPADNFHPHFGLKPFDDYRTQDSFKPPEGCKFQGNFIPPNSFQSQGNVIPSDNSSVTPSESQRLQSSVSPFDIRRCQGSVTPSHSQRSQNRVSPSDNHRYQDSVTICDRQEYQDSVTTSDSQRSQSYVSSSDSHRYQGSVTPSNSQRSQSYVPPLDSHRYKDCQTSSDSHRSHTSSRPPDIQRTQGSHRLPDNSQFNFKSSNSQFQNNFKPSENCRLQSNVKPNKSRSPVNFQPDRYKPQDSFQSHNYKPHDGFKPPDNYKSQTLERKDNVYKIPEVKNRPLSVMTLPVNCLKSDTDLQPEMYSASSSGDREFKRPRLSKDDTSAACEIQCDTGHRRSSGFIGMNSEMSMKASINKIESDNQKKLSIPEEVKINSFTSGLPLTQPFVNNNKLHTDCLIEVSKQQEHQGFSGVISVRPSESHNDIPVITQSKPTWKPGSMRLSTQGYTSLSDQANSLESLPVKTQQPSITSSHNHCTNKESRHGHVYLDNICSDEQRTCFDDMDSNTAYTKEHTSGTCQLDMNINFKQPVVRLERSGTNRLSYKMATASISDLSIADEDLHKYLNGSKRQILINGKSNHQTEIGFCVTGSHAEKSAINDKAMCYDQLVSNGINQECGLLEKITQEEQIKKIKRLSFKLATCSLSDLTFPDNEDFVNSVKALRENSRGLFDADKSTESSNNSNLQTLGPNIEQTGNASFSNSCLNASYGSFYSCQSLGSQESKSPQVPSYNETKIQQQYNKDMRDFSLSYSPCVGGYSSGFDFSLSADNSLYCTASSDASFITAEGTPTSIPHSGETKQKSPEHIPQDQGLKLQSSLRRSPQNVVDSQRLTHRNMYDRTKLSKPSSPINNMFVCYGCGPNEKPSPQVHYHNNKICEAPDAHKNWEEIEVPSKFSHEVSNRCQSPPSEYMQARQSDHSSRKVPHQILTFPKTGGHQHDQTPTGSMLSRSDSSSQSSLVQNGIWEHSSRLPPSLGRPKRKTYAGFDSQPLPMESFLSDSSSVYSIQSNSSWGASRSAEVESSPRTTCMSPTIRAVSSIVSSTHTPSRPATHDSVLDFFTYSDKHSSVRENNHNYYLSGENSFVDDCFKESFYDMRFSNESLESFLSDSTTIGVDHHDFSDTQDYVKSGLKQMPPSGRMYNNSAIASKKRSNERPPLSRLNNSCGSEFGSKLSNNSGSIPASAVVNGKIQLKTIQNSSSATAARQNFMTKQKYTSKDIFDIIKSSDKNSLNGPKLLERDANKVCEAILCCDEIVQPPAREYHF